MCLVVIWKVVKVGSVGDNVQLEFSLCGLEFMVWYKVDIRWQCIKIIGLVFDIEYIFLGVKFFNVEFI